VAQAQAYVTDGYRFVVDIDLAKFFDRVNHDKLMARVAARIPDRRVLRLIRSYLTAGVINNGLFEISREGTPQGGPLSPLLSNLVLDELDRELERRGHCFVRYADDCNIYVRSEPLHGWPFVPDSPDNHPPWNGMIRPDGKLTMTGRVYHTTTRVEGQISAGAFDATLHGTCSYSWHLMMKQ
jgi:hypothetical protein